MTSRFEEFLAFSAEMCCFTRFELLGTGQAEAYARAAQEAAGDAFDALLACYRDLPTDDTRLLAVRRRIMGDEFIGPVARAIVKMWYIGIWYEMPRGWTEKFGARGRNTSFVVTPAAYAEGLLWPAIGAHPPGAKAPGYGSWAAAPDIPGFTCTLAAARPGSAGPMVTQTEEGHVAPHHLPKAQHPPPPPGGSPR